MQRRAAGSGRYDGLIATSGMRSYLLVSLKRKYTCSIAARDGPVAERKIKD